MGVGDGVERDLGHGGLEGPGGVVDLAAEDVPAAIDGVEAVALGEPGVEDAWSAR